MMHKVEEVFKFSGVPTVTFVYPDHYNRIKVSLRTPGRGLALEGPSGIGKTSLVAKLLEELEFAGEPEVLSGRVAKDIARINDLPNREDFGLVIVDDFHRLDEKSRNRLADFIKVLADSEDDGRKIVLIGINKAGDQLIRFGRDLGLRMDILTLEANSPGKIIELIEKGEVALNIEFPHKQELADRCQGSFQIAQLLCFNLCVQAGVLETQKTKVKIELPLDVVIEEVMAELSRQFKDGMVAFARGTKIRPEGKAPYLHILKWLAESDEGSIDLLAEMNARPDLKGSVGQVVNKEFLKTLMDDPEKRKLFEDILFYDDDTKVFGAEDPKFSFYIKNIVWRGFARECGFAGDFFGSKYDFALSFAGNDRPIVEALVACLKEREIEVFYDFNEQHRILGANVEEYLAPIYRSESRYVVPFLSREYPKRIWTKFESDQFRDRFGAGSVIPIRFSDVEGGWFSDEGKYGGLMFDASADVGTEIGRICETLAARIVEDRQSTGSND